VTELYAHFRTAAPRYAVRHTSLLPRPAEQHYYLTAGQQDNRTILGLRVNLINTWLPGKGGKIDMMSGRPAAMAACPAPLLGWVGGKAWWSTGYRTGNDPVSMRKKELAEFRNNYCTSPPTLRETTSKDDPFWKRNSTIFNLSTYIHMKISTYFSRTFFRS
jgi:hypothetical protein